MTPKTEKPPSFDVRPKIFENFKKKVVRVERRRFSYMGLREHVFDP